MFKSVLPGVFAGFSFLVFAVNSASALDGDVEAGATVFKKCQSCHVADEAKNKVGPSLQNLFGRQPGTAAEFKYSKAMVEFGEGKVWSEELLMEYLPAPKELVKGTKMAFVGLKKEEDVVNIIAYLKQFSPDASEAPAEGATPTAN